MNEKQLIEVSAQIYRLESVLNAAQKACPDWTGDNAKELLDDLNQTKLLLETGRYLLWTIHNIVEDATGEGRSEKPSDL